MTPEDRAWEMAGLARADGDREDERRWTNIARSLPPETIRLRCWPCVGNGLIAYPRSPIITVPDM